MRLTDVVVKAQQRATEFCRRRALVNKLLLPQVRGLDVPLSPFMMTHILDPTHLSTSSAVPVSRWPDQGPVGRRAMYLGVELEMSSSLSPNR